LDVKEMRKRDGFRSVLIFGGAGFIGSNWAHHLLENTDAQVHIFDNLSRPGVRHNLEALERAAGRSGRLQITVGDTRNAALVERAVRGASEIYQLAAQVAVTSSMADPRQDFEINVAGTFNVLEAARKGRRRPFLLFTSTNKVYGQISEQAVEVNGNRYQYKNGGGISEAQPLDFHSPYGCSKGAADQYVRDYGRIYDLPTTVLRMSCIAGPRQFGNEDQGWVAHFLYSALRQQQLVIYGDGRQVRDVLCVYDLLRIFEAARQRHADEGGEIYNVGGGAKNTVSLLELMDNIEELTGQQVQYRLDMPRPGDQLVYVTDIGKLYRELGWKPHYSVAQTLELIYQWWKRNREVVASPAGAEPDALPALQQLPGTAA
jgi:CDP-paratose 2-epimerase